MTIDPRVLVITSLKSDTPPPLRNSAMLFALAKGNDTIRTFGVTQMIDQANTYAKGEAAQAEIARISAEQARESESLVEGLFKAVDPETHLPEAPTYAPQLQAFKANLKAGKYAEAGLAKVVGYQKRPGAEVTVPLEEPKIDSATVEAVRRIARGERPTEKQFEAFAFGVATSPQRVQRLVANLRTDLLSRHSAIVSGGQNIDFDKFEVDYKVNDIKALVPDDVEG
ncbi:MAG: hypothetical protein AAGF20_05310 [Pseudomonadota bacterium]